MQNTEALNIVLNDLKEIIDHMSSEDQLHIFRLLRYHNAEYKELKDRSDGTASTVVVDLKSLSKSCVREMTSYIKGSKQPVKSAVPLADTMTTSNASLQVPTNDSNYSKPSTTGRTFTTLQKRIKKQLKELRKCQVRSRKAGDESRLGHSFSSTEGEVVNDAESTFEDEALELDGPDENVEEETMEHDDPDMTEEVITEANPDETQDVQDADASDTEETEGTEAKMFDDHDVMSVDLSQDTAHFHEVIDDYGVTTEEIKLQFPVDSTKAERMDYYINLLTPHGFSFSSDKPDDPPTEQQLASTSASSSSSGSSSKGRKRTAKSNRTSSGSTASAKA